MPREGLGVVIKIRSSRGVTVQKLIEDARQVGEFYTHFHPAGEPIEFPNMDGTEDVSLTQSPCDHVGITSGGKMWCGYDAFVEHVRELACHLEDAMFYVGDSEDYIDEFRLEAGVLHYRRVHEGFWLPVEEYVRSLDGH